MRHLRRRRRRSSVAASAGGQNWGGGLYVIRTYLVADDVTRVLDKHQNQEQKSDLL